MLINFVNRLYNAPKFRFQGLEIVEDRVKFQVGLTDYKDLQGTHHAQNCQDLVKLAIQNCDKGNKLSKQPILERDTK